MSASTNRRLSPIAAVGALIVVTMLFTLWYARWWPALEPYSDNAEALEIESQVLSWADPWAVPTSLGNPLSPMLGGFLLAVPFVLLPIQWGMYLHQMAWLGAFVIFVVRSAGPHAAVMVAALLLISPHTRYAVPGGSDNWLMAIAVVLAGTWGFRALRDALKWPHWWASAIFLALAMSWRATVWVAVLPLVVLFLRSFGARGARWLSAVASVAAVLVLLPLLITRTSYPNGPVAMTLNKAAGGVEYSGLIVATVMLIATMVMSWRVHRSGGRWVAACCGSAAMVAATVLTKVPALGWHGALGSYEGVAYNGIWLVFGLTALALPRVQAEKLSLAPAHTS